MRVLVKILRKGRKFICRMYVCFRQVIFFMMEEFSVVNLLRIRFFWEWCRVRGLVLVFIKGNLGV